MPGRPGVRQSLTDPDVGVHDPSIVILWCGRRDPNPHPNAALAGFGLAYVPEDVAPPHLSKGRLKRVLDDWRPPYSGYHLYDQGRGRPTQAFTLLVDTLILVRRWRRRSWRRRTAARCPERRCGTSRSKPCSAPHDLSRGCANARAARIRRAKDAVDKLFAAPSPEEASFARFRGAGGLMAARVTR